MDYGIPPYVVPMPTWLITRHRVIREFWPTEMAYTTEPFVPDSKERWERDRAEWVRVAEGWKR